MKRNRVKDIREKLLMSKAELARKAGVSPLTNKLYLESYLTGFSEYNILLNML